MIVRTEEVVQSIDGAHAARFVKEVVHVHGTSATLSMIRKRLPERLAPRHGYLAPVLLTHGFGQNRYAWHLSGRSFVNFLAHEGFDVYNLDLRGHGRSQHLGSSGALCVDEYIKEDVPAAVAEVLALSGRSALFTVGHSLGGLIAYAAAPDLGAALAGIVTIGSPFRFARGSRALQVFARIVDTLAGGRVSARATWRLPIRHLGQAMLAQRAMWDSRFAPLPVRAWAPGGMEPHVLSEYLRRSFDSASIGTLVQMALIARDGRFHSRDGAEDYLAQFEACCTPLLVIAGQHDLLAPPASVRPAFERSQARDKQYRLLPFGHADLLLGANATRTTWPLVSSWLRARLARFEGR